MQSIGVLFLSTAADGRLCHLLPQGEKGRSDRHEKFYPPVGFGPLRSSLDCAASIHLEGQAMSMQNSNTADEAQIRSLIDQRADALYAKDAQAALSCLTADFIEFSLAPPLISTMADAAAYEAWFATWRGALKSATSILPSVVISASATASI